MISPTTLARVYRNNSISYHKVKFVQDLQDDKKERQEKQRKEKFQKIIKAYESGTPILWGDETLFTFKKRKDYSYYKKGKTLIVKKEQVIPADYYAFIGVI